MHPKFGHKNMIKTLCARCVGEPYLSELIQRDGEERDCSYCGDRDSTMAIDTIARLVDDAFSRHYVRTPENAEGLEYALLAAGELGYWERSGRPAAQAIQNAARIPDAAAVDIQQLLESNHTDVEAMQLGDETEFADTAYYAQRAPDADLWHKAYHDFTYRLKTEARYLGDPANAFLESVFRGIGEMSTADGRSPIVQVGPGTQLPSIYRARVFQSADALKEALTRPDISLGPPPARRARPGRLNALGIAVFYGGESARVALAEVRPPVGSYVVVARFELLRALRLLDLNLVKQVLLDGSVFDPQYIGELARHRFLVWLGGQFSRPVMPDDEMFDYLPTQVMAEFLAADPMLQLDGIMMRSAQAPSENNVVLFHKAARVSHMNVSPRTLLEAKLGYWTDEGWEDDFHVFEGSKSGRDGDSLDPCQCEFGDEEWGVVDAAYEALQSRPESLRVRLNNISVHRVKEIRIVSEQFPVSGYRRDLFS